MLIAIDKVAFDIQEPDRGFTMKAYYLNVPRGDALVELYRDGLPYHRFLWPVYKVFNLSAHFSDIVDDEISRNFPGYDLAGWNNISCAPVAVRDGGPQ